MALTNSRHIEDHFGVCTSQVGLNFCELNTSLVFETKKIQFEFCGNKEWIDGAHCCQSKKLIYQVKRPAWV